MLGRDGSGPRLKFYGNRGWNGFQRGGGVSPGRLKATAPTPQDRWLPPGTGKILVGVQVIGARVSYGRTQLQVQPLSGRGSRWVDAEMTQELED